MNKLLHPCQTDFVKGRYITDQVMLLQEVLRENKFRKQQGVVLKIDFKKVYDKVNWEFMFDCCKQKGFSDNWMIWIRKVVTGGTLSVKVNDKVGPYFTSYRATSFGIMLIEKPAYGFRWGKTRKKLVETALPLLLGF
jgi:hypothetical protein